MQRLPVVNLRILNLSLIILLISFILHFLFPLPSPSWINVNYHGITYSYNVDSPEFARGVIDFPGERFFKGNIRSNRPLYIFISWLIYKPLKFLGMDKMIPSGLINICKEDMKRAFTRSEMWLSEYKPADIILSWLSLIFVSVILFLISFFIIGRLCLDFTLSFRVSFILMLTLFFDLKLSMDGIVWFPHTDAFDILVPAMTTYFCFKVFNEGGRYYLLYCLLIGILMLGKGEFYAVLIIAFVPLFVKRVSLSKSIIGLLIGLAPTLFYISFLNIKGYGYYSPEMEVYRQGIWYIDVLREKGPLLLIKEALLKSKDIFENTLVALRINFGLLTILLIYSLRRGLNLKNRFVFTFGFNYLVFNFLFWLWVGFTPVRLMFTFYPPIYLILLILVREVFNVQGDEALHSDSPR